MLAVLKGSAAEAVFGYSHNCPQSQPIMEHLDAKASESIPPSKAPDDSNSPNISSGFMLNTV